MNILLKGTENYLQAEEIKQHIIKEGCEFPNDVFVKEPALILVLQCDYLSVIENIKMSDNFLLCPSFRDFTVFKSTSVVREEMRNGVICIDNTPLKEDGFYIQFDKKDIDKIDETLGQFYYYTETILCFNFEKTFLLQYLPEYEITIFAQFDKVELFDSHFLSENIIKTTANFDDEPLVAKFIEKMNLNYSCIAKL